MLKIKNKTSYIFAKKNNINMFIAVSATFNTQLNCYHRFVASLIASDNCIFCRTSS